MLLARVAEQDQAAFAELYRRHAGAVYSRAWRVLTDRQAAEDVVQEVFLRLWERPERVDSSRGTLRTFLLLDATGRGSDVVRAISRRGDREGRALRLTANGQYDLETEIENHVVASLVREAILDLPRAERQALELAYFGHHTYRQVSALLGTPEGTIKSRIRNGLVRLRDRLSAEGLIEP